MELAARRPNSDLDYQKEVDFSMCKKLDILLASSKAFLAIYTYTHKSMQHWAINR
jgi:hypothetical protein